MISRAKTSFRNFSAQPIVLTLGIPTVIAVWSVRKKSLTARGSVGAWVVGSITAATGLVPTVTLLTFFFSSSYITKFGSHVKKSIDAHYHPKGHRTLKQVLCNSAPAIVLGIAALGGWIPNDRRYLLSVVAHYAACQGDTWSSEIGVLSSQPPRLICGFRRVPKGTNGGVSLLGFAAALAGGTFLGLTSSFAASATTTGVSPVRILGTAVVSAIAGTVLDSFLGQFLQRSVEDSAGRISAGGEGNRVSGFDVLSNDSVNLFSSAAITFAVWMYA
jgi:uncharacterized protein (TIGR00297 family)